MKRNIVFKEKGKVIKTLQITERDESHLQACIKYPSQVFKAKKGKGSYTRKEKHRKDYRNDYPLQIFSM